MLEHGVKEALPGGLLSEMTEWILPQSWMSCGGHVCMASKIAFKHAVQHLDNWSGFWKGNIKVVFTVPVCLCCS